MNKTQSKQTNETIKLIRMLGLAQKAGKVRSGEFGAEESVKTGKARLCLLAKDASDRTRKHMDDICAYRDIPLLYTELTKDELGHSLGRDERSSLTIEDIGFADKICELIGGGNACGK